MPHFLSKSYMCSMLLLITLTLQTRTTLNCIILTKLPTPQRAYPVFITVYYKFPCVLKGVLYLVSTKSLIPILDKCSNFTTQGSQHKLVCGYKGQEKRHRVGHVFWGRVFHISLSSLDFSYFVFFYLKI